MPEAETPRSIILQEAWRKFIEGGMRRGAWVTVCSLREKILEGISFYCALIPKRYVGKFFEGNSWDFYIGDGAPAVWQGWGPKPRLWYERFGQSTGVEPFVLYRSYLGHWESHLELSQEFRLYCNLFHNSRAGVYLAVDQNGDPEEVVRMSETQVEVKLPYLHQFLAAKQMHLGLFYEGDAFTKEAVGELGLTDGFTIDYHENDIRYALVVRENSVDAKRGRTWSRLLGKTLIRCQPRTGEAPFARHRKQSFSEFVIGCDDKGYPLKRTCDPEKLANSGKNPGAPHFLTPIHFRRNVLQKYYDNPHRYEVTDGSVRCGGKWSLRIDNDRPDRVIVWLGDLGQSLTEGEMLHWQHHNVVPEGGISRTSYLRNIQGMFADPEMPDLTFKHVYPRINEGWQKRFGFPLFLPLQKRDEHVFRALRVPLDENRAEFDGQVLSLAKLLVDSLNEAALQRELVSTIPDEKGIAKFARWLRKKQLSGWESHLRFLRNLQALRAGSAHRKGTTYAEAAKAFRLDDHPLTQVGFSIFAAAVEWLKYLRAIEPQ
jgi:hypothetical protein